MVVINCFPCPVQARHKSEEISTHLQDWKELSKFRNKLHSPFWRPILEGFKTAEISTREHLDTAILIWIKQAVGDILRSLWI